MKESCEVTARLVLVAVIKYACFHACCHDPRSSNIWCVLHHASIEPLILYHLESVKLSRFFFRDQFWSASCILYMIFIIGEILRMYSTLPVEMRLAIPRFYNFQSAWTCIILLQGRHRQHCFLPSAATNCFIPLVPSLLEFFTKTRPSSNFCTVPAVYGRFSPPSNPQFSFSSVVMGTKACLVKPSSCCFCCTFRPTDMSGVSSIADLVTRSCGDHLTAAHWMTQTVVQINTGFFVVQACGQANGRRPQALVDNNLQCRCHSVVLFSSFCYLVLGDSFPMYH